MVSVPMKYSKVNNFGRAINFKGFPFLHFRESILLGCYPVVRVLCPVSWTIVHTRKADISVIERN